ncbi:serine/threonine-protein kinase [Candidatus Uabimicrobium amorphum]|uniref:Protein kinase n=1 Tax=Uabimicrobium amorphum TaxID=2596890 RepID=A0A5S9IHE4_UABAM|nr:serine/threonine-protein kinase [Candidatus Uabimicrobium amorphum]BBM81859.1 protein kinase [Candidatus Uabimicrobium amorphum]
MKKWFLKSKKDGQIFGPYTQQQVQKFFSEKKSNDFLISTDRVTWKPSVSKQKYLGKYEVLEEVGRGGMGVVYRARDTQLNRECALKVLTIADNKEVGIQRFFNEARAVAKIQHPYIVRIHEIYTEPHYFFAMDYIAGIPFDKYIKIDSISLNAKLELFIKICEAVAFAHEKKILHRDLKPSNVLVCQDSETYPIVLDFGIAKHTEAMDGLTKTGEIFGTPKYMAPEAANAEVLDVRSDVYSLGVMLYQMLTGHVPFNVESFVALVYQIAVEDPVPPSRLNSAVAKGSSLEIVCLKALEKNREKRIQSVSFLKTELESILQNRAIRSKAPGAWQKFSKWYKRNYLLGTLLTSLLIVLIASSSVFLILWNKAQQENLRIEKHNLLIAKQKENIIQEKDFIQRRLLESRLHSFVEKLPQEDITTNLSSLKKMYFMFDKMIRDKKDVDAELRNQYRLLSNRLKFLAATRLPKKRTVRFKNKNGSAVFSGNQRRLAQFINKHIYVWNIDENIRRFLPKNAFASVDIKVAMSIFSLSQSGRYLAYSGDQTENGEFELFVHDVEKNRQVFRGQGGLRSIRIRKDESAIVFRSGNFFHVYDLQKQRRVHSFSVPGKKLNSLLSNNDRWLAVLCSDVLFICDLENYKTYTQREKLFRSSAGLVFSADYKHLYVFTFFNIVVYNLSSRTIRVLPMRQINLEFTVPPVATTDAHVFLADKNGGLISVHHKDFTSAAVYEKIPQLISRKVSRIEACPPSAIAISKGNILQIRDTHTFKNVYNIVEDHHIQQFKLKRTAKGLEVKTITKEKYCHYTYAIADNPLPSDHKTVAQKLLKSMPFVAEIGRKILICDKKNVMIYPHLFGFSSWNDNGEFFFRRATYQHPFDFKRSEDESLLAISIAPNRLKLYDTTRFAMLSENFVASRMDKITFSLDNKFIFLGGQRGEIGLFDIKERKFKMLGNITFTCEAMATLDKNIFIATTTQGRIDVGGFSICRYENGKFFHKKFNKIKHSLIPTVGVNRKNKLFALGDNYGRFSVWRGFETPQLDFEGEVIGQILGISISEDGEYVAIFTMHSIYVYDRKAKETYSLYRGYRKFGTSNFSTNWKNAYFGNGEGGIYVVEQNHFFDRGALQEVVKRCDLLLNDDSSWWKLIEKIENKLSR